MALLWTCLPSLGGPSCVGPAPAFYRDWGAGFWFEISAIPATPSLYKMQVHRSHTGRAIRPGRHVQRRAILCWLALLFEMLVGSLQKAQEVGKEGTLSKKTASWQLTRLGAAVLRKSAPIRAGQSC